MYTNKSPQFLLEATQVVKDTEAADVIDRVYGLRGILTSNATLSMDVGPDNSLQRWLVE